MPTVYCDQNSLSAFVKAGPDYIQHIKEQSRDGRFRLVFSSWHWVEMARTKNLGEALTYAETADAISGAWIRERISLQRDEVHEAFFRWLGVPYQKPPALIDRTEMIADFTGRTLAVASALSSRDFVSGWNKDPRQMDGVIDAHGIGPSLRCSIQDPQHPAPGLRLFCTIRNGDADE